MGDEKYRYLEDGLNFVGPFDYHAIRHYVDSLLADREKVGITTVSRLLRHQSIRTNEIYLHPVDDGLRQAMGRLVNLNLNLLTEPTHREAMEG